ncbi:MAG: Wzz/FepE/Etk N-terminal domain-containing protein [Lachnospiraceae bacterium]|nr:Wzz/FepE/Etk N-terminal domain-containing protein [Lachnospiraceae bacterium]
MDERNKNDEVELDLKELFYVLWERKLVIFFAGLAVGLIALFVTKVFITPEFESTTKIYVLSQDAETTGNVDYSQLQTGSMLTKDYMELVTSRPVLEQVITDLDLDLTNEELMKKITVTTPTDTRVLSITVTDADPYTARDIANETRIAAGDHIARVTAAKAVNVVEDANIPTVASSPSTMKNVVIGGMAGLLLAILIIVLNYMMNDTLRTSEDVEKYLGLSTLGIIPVSMNEPKTKKKKRKHRNK